MPTTYEMISKWFDSGKSNGFTHMLVICDTFSLNDHPRYVTGASEARDEYYNAQAKASTRVMEVYNLQDDKEEQMALDRCFRFYIGD